MDTFHKLCIFLYFSFSFFVFHIVYSSDHDPLVYYLPLKKHPTLYITDNIHVLRH